MHKMSVLAICEPRKHVSLFYHCFLPKLIKYHTLKSGGQIRDPDEIWKLCSAQIKRMQYTAKLDGNESVRKKYFTTNFPVLVSKNFVVSVHVTKLFTRSEWFK